VFRGAVYGVEVAIKALETQQQQEQQQPGEGGSAAAPTAAAASSEHRQFAAELDLLLAVTHPNICRLLGVSDDGPQKCLVLELCPGGSLDKHLKADRGRMRMSAGAGAGAGAGSDEQAVIARHAHALSWLQRLQVAVAIARALVHLHTLSPPMVHRDVKCQVQVTYVRKPLYMYYSSTNLYLVIY
jgi:serine/threonine protein kinase